MDNCNELPNTLHELLYVALCDLEKIERDPRYKVDMGRWHTPMEYDDREVCHVCLAGSVMAMECDISPNKNVWASDFHEGNYYLKFMALDYLRVGSIRHAVRTLMIDYNYNYNYNPSVDGFKDIPLYEDEPKLWWDYMQDILGYLQFLEI